MAPATPSLVMKATYASSSPVSSAHPPNVHRMSQSTAAAIGAVTGILVALMVLGAYLLYKRFQRRRSYKQSYMQQPFPKLSATSTPASSFDTTRSSRPQTAEFSSAPPPPPFSRAQSARSAHTHSRTRTQSFASHKSQSSTPGRTNRLSRTPSLHEPPPVLPPTTRQELTRPEPARSDSALRREEWQDFFLPLGRGS